MNFLALRSHPLLAFILSTCLLFSSGCEQRPQVHQQQILALGTLVDISLYNVDDKTAQDAVLKITQSLETIHHDWHAWQSSKLTAINKKLSRGDPVTLDDEGEKLIRAAITLSANSNGLFNPAAGQLIGLWGFHSDERPTSEPPTGTAIKTWLTHKPGMADLTLNNSVLKSSNSNVQLDLGGYAKGYAVDMAIAELKKLGINNAIVNAGGDLRTIGSKGDQPWRIGIRHPRQPGVIASLETSGDESIFTSGDYERYFEYQSQHYHHILDPHTGYPAKGATSVTVIHQDAATADAAATALFIAGPESWRNTAKSMGVNHVMLISQDGTIHMTETMAKRIQFETDTRPQTNIVP
jgi:thiamine biosynthesis lipoprotein